MTEPNTESVLREGVAYTIWSHTGSEGDCPDDGQYEPCESCMKVIYLPAADAVLAVIREEAERTHIDGEVRS